MPGSAWSRATCAGSTRAGFPGGRARFVAVYVVGAESTKLCSPVPSFALMAKNDAGMHAFGSVSLRTWFTMQNCCSVPSPPTVRWPAPKPPSGKSTAARFAPSCVNGAGYAETVEDESCCATAGARGFAHSAASSAGSGVG